MCVRGNKREEVWNILYLFHSHKRLNVSTMQRSALTKIHCEPPKEFPLRESRPVKSQNTVCLPWGAKKKRKKHKYKREK